MPQVSASLQVRVRLRIVNWVCDLIPHPRALPWAGINRPFGAIGTTVHNLSQCAALGWYEPLWGFPIITATATGPATTFCEFHIIGCLTKV